MSLPKRQAKYDKYLGLLQHVQDCLHSQSEFLQHLSIDDFRTNRILFDKICSWNYEMKRTIEQLMSIAPPVEQV